MIHCALIAGAFCGSRQIISDIKPGFGNEAAGSNDCHEDFEEKPCLLSEM